MYVCYVYFNKDESIVPLFGTKQFLDFRRDMMEDETFQ